MELFNIKKTPATVVCEHDDFYATLFEKGRLSPIDFIEDSDERSRVEAAITTILMYRKSLRDAGKLQHVDKHGNLY